MLSLNQHNVTENIDTEDATMFILQLLVIMSIMSAATCLFLSAEMLRTAHKLSREASASVESFSL